MASIRKYYPGILAALFLVLLRTAIGWHFLTEGLWKVEAKDGRPFSAEGYLRASVGPFSEHFRNIVPDVDAKDRLRRDGSGRPIGLKQRWADELERIATHYRFDAEQRKRAQAKLDEQMAIADEWFLNRDNADKVQKYLDEIARIESIENNPKALTSQREVAVKAHKEADTARRELVVLIDGWSDDLTTAWTDPQMITAQQKSSYGEFKAPVTQLDLVNETTKWGLTIVGGLLLVGLFTPLAGLGGAALLLMFYLSQPPFPGLPEPPNLEGHYRYVNKNLIELIACLVIATTGSGRWIGLDALIFGRRREAAVPDESPNVNLDPPGSNPAPLKPDRPRGSKEPRQPVPLG